MSLKTWLGYASAAAAFVLCAPGYAQEAQPSAEPADQDAIVVTGLRASVQSSQEIRRNSSQIVDSIVAEDVGKLPDNNVAEALARVTGIQIRRDSGEGNSVLIRGLPQIVTLLNGREVFTTTGRFIALADVPANMLQRVDAYKSVSAEQIEGGIAGLIDIRTRRPFDNPGLQLNANLRGAYNDKAEAWDPNVGVTLSNTWEAGAGEFGALIGLSYIRSNFHEERAFNIESVNQAGFFNATHPAPTVPFLGPFVMGYIPISGERERPSVNIALQWRPDADSEIYLEAFDTEYQNDFSLDFFVGLPFLGDGNITGTVFPGTNVMHTLTNHNVFTITSTQANHQESSTQQVAVGGHHTAGELTLSADVSWTKSTFDFENPILDVGVIVPLVNVSTDVDGTAQLDYGGPGFDIRRQDGFFLVNFFDNYGHAEGQSTDARLDAVWEPLEEGFFRKIALGGRIAAREAESIRSFIGGDGDPLAFTLASSIPGLGCVSEPMADGGPDYVMTQWFTPCRDFLLNNTGVIRQAFNGMSAPRPLDPGFFFSDEETTSAIYLQADIGGELGSFPWTGVVGVRYVKTDESLRGNSSQDTDPTHPGLEYTPIDSDSTSYDLLPNASFKLNFTDEWVARFSAVRTITRPDFEDLNPGVSLSTVVSNTTGLTGAGGNPNLRPVQSDNFDVALEWYFDDAGAITATAFYREFEGYIQPAVFFEVYGGLTYRVVRPGNTGSGSLQGFELNYQQFYDFLPGFLSGLGLQANATWMEGDTENPTTGDSLSITGLSEFSYNIIGLYEKGPWSGRLAYNWRDNFLDVRNIAAGYDLFVDATAQLDGQISYALNDNVTLSVEGINLLDTEFKDYFDDPNNPQLAGLFPRDTRRYDRTVLLGVRWRN